MLTTANISGIVLIGTKATGVIVLLELGQYQLSPCEALRILEPERPPKLGWNSNGAELAVFLHLHQGKLDLFLNFRRTLFII